MLLAFISVGSPLKPSGFHIQVGQGRCFPKLVLLSCKQENFPHFQVQKAILNLFSSLCMVLLDLIQNPFCQKIAFCCHLKYISLSMLLSIQKEELSIQLQRYNAILTSVMPVVIFPPILMEPRFSSTIFIDSVAFIGFLPPSIFPLDYKKVLF